MKKPPFQADNPEQAMQNFNDALRAVLSVSKEELKKDAGWKAGIRATQGAKKKAKEKP
jgi:hypothetical protein